MGSRQDDLMSLTLMLIDLANGECPWDNGWKRISKGAWIDRVALGRRTKKLARLSGCLRILRA